ncbi:hypothetical protein ACWF9B_03285 [Streptomyces sp. NPDC055089]
MAASSEGGGQAAGSLLVGSEAGEFAQGVAELLVARGLGVGGLDRLR